MSKEFIKPNSLYILGTSKLGITNVPTRINDEVELVSYFGDEGSLITAYRKLRDITNIPEVYLCKCNGTHSTANLNIINNNEVIENAVVFRSIYSNELYSGITILLTDNFLQIIHNGEILEYNFKVYSTTHALFKAINEDAKHRISPVTVVNYTLEEYSHPAKVLVSCNEPIIHLNDSYSGIEDTKNQLYENMKTTLEYLEGLSIDCIIFADCYLDDSSPTFNIENSDQNTYPLKNIFNGLDYDIISFYDLMLKFCSRQLKSSILTKGIIGFNPMIKDKSVEEICKYKDLMDEIMKRGRYSNAVLSLVTITCGDVYYDNGGMIDNHYIAYAGVYLSEQYNSSITNVNYGDDISIRTYFNKNEADKLSELQFSIIRLSPLTNKTHIVNAVTQGEGVYSLEYAIRSAQVFFKSTQENLRQHIGEVINRDSEQNILKTLDEILNNMRNLKCIEDYKTNLITSQNGQSKIDCNLYFHGFLDPMSFSLDYK